ncbi:MAG: hypothetical protein IKZ48_08240 [Prevotella sp.]|nr:hypothetical protein [Prevotella sp.]
MISELKLQTNETIFRFLTQLGKREDVYSSRPEDLCPTLQDSNVYVYAKEQELVVVLVDVTMTGTQEEADLEFSNPVMKAYFHNATSPFLERVGEYRDSPVWQLFQAARSLHKLINKDVELPVQVHTVLVTNSSIVNIEELQKAIANLDEEFGLTIFHNCQSFCDQWSVFKLPVNPDFFLMGATYLQTYKHELSMQFDADKEIKEFERRLLEFMGKQPADDQSGEDEVDDDLLGDEVLEDEEFDDDDQSYDDEPDADLHTRLAACRSIQERKLVMLSYAKRQVLSP